MPTATINGVDVYFEVSGDGPALLFLNGSGSTIADVRPLVARFAERFRVAIADSRGIGRSSIPADAYTMAELASDAVALTDQLGWDTFALMGVSFGGMVAQEVAVTAPTRIRRLVLACTSAGGAGGSSYPLHELAALPPAERVALSTSILDTRFDPEWLAGHPADRALVDQAERRRDRTRTEAAERGAELQLRARTGHDVFDRLPRITCPTLVASGRFDGIAPPANGAAIAGRIPGATLRLYDGGHLFFLQDPAAIPDIVDFLDA